LEAGSTKTCPEARPKRRGASWTGPGKNWKPFRVDAQYRCSERACQALWEIALNPRISEPYGSPSCTGFCASEGGLRRASRTCPIASG
jgi:hypothetical protein